MGPATFCLNFPGDPKPFIRQSIFYLFGKAVYLKHLWFQILNSKLHDQSSNDDSNGDNIIDHERQGFGLHIPPLFHPS